MKIIMITDSMGVGGAESHICVLCRELSARGHNVKVISSGGVSAERLARSGIRQIKLPTNAKNPLTVFFTKSMLYEILKKEVPDIVHAHSRMSAFIAEGVCKNLQIPLIVTAHAMFSVTPLKSVLSRWGDYTIAVSEDIKRLLADFYGCEENKITVIGNGVEYTENLSHTEKNGKNILFVSRMDGDSSLGAFLLCHAAASLNDDFPDMTITLVGGGECLEKVKKEAEHVNIICKREVVRVVGRAVNPEKYFLRADLFVGVSRAALEAMSFGVPVILLGNEGYLGLFGEDKYEKAVKSNFCCRGEGRAGREALEKEIKRFFLLSDAEKEAYSKYGRALIAKGYNVRIMAEKTVSVYSDAVKLRSEKKENGKRVLICGYYGYGNFGDDAILESTVSKLRELYPDAEICAMTRDPDRDRQLYGVRCIDRFSLRDIVSEMKKSDVFLFGGGSLMQDKTSLRSLLYYVSISYLAGKYCKREIMFANGIGPFISGFGEKIFFASLENFDLISVRDTLSENYISGKVKDRKITFFPDPVFTLLPVISQTEQGEGKGGGYFVVSYCQSCGSADYLPMLANVIRRISDRFGYVPFYAVFNEEKDMEGTEKLIKEVNRYCGTVKVIKGIEECTSLFSRAEFVLGMRLHSLIFSALCKTIPIVFGDDAKLLGFCRDFSLHRPFLHGDSTCDIMSVISTLIEEREETIKNISEKSVEFCKRANCGFSEIFEDITER